jgi:drug/metabolite transporter (DMT)-like permease
MGLVLVLVSAAGFASLAIFGKQAYRAGLDLVDVLVLRFGLAAPLLWALAALARRRLRVGAGAALRLTAMGSIGYAIQASLFFAALSRISAGLAGLLLYLYPALVTLGAVALGRHRLDRWTLAGLGFALGGTMLILGLPGERLDPLGVTLGLASAAWYTLYILVGEQLLRGADPLVAAAHVATGAAVSYLMVGGLLLGELDLGGARPGGFAITVAMATLATAVPIAAFLAGLSALGSTWASIASAFEPAMTVALGALLLGEPLGAGKLAGGLAVVAGAIALPLVAGGRGRSERPQAAEHP